jgi:two-component system copper resistance phosphate regulon response regulator CusR
MSVRLLIFTDMDHLGYVFRILFEDTADIFVYPIDSLYHLNTSIFLNSYITIGIHTIEELDWLSFKRMQKVSCQGIYLVLGSPATHENYKKALDAGFKDVLIDPLFTLKDYFIEQGLLPFTDLKNAIIHHESEILYLGAEIYFNRRELWVGTEEEKRQLSDREVQLLNLFLENEGNVITKSVIANELWNNNVDSAGISKLVKRLRDKIGVPNLIVGRKQGGYIFKKKG